jgi:preprotein translocase subunit SecY/protein transport protein SEC61 subunit alpha
VAGRFLKVFEPISRFIPEVRSPERRVRFTEKILWTAVALILYLVMSEVPLYGIGLGGGQDSLLYYRVIFASNKGSLMELGIGPIVTAGLILQLLAGSGFIQCDFSDPEDRSLFTAASKVLSIVMTGVQASAYFIVAGVAQRIMLDCFSTFPAPGSDPMRYQGVITALIHAVATGRTLNDIFVSPQNHPSLIGLASTIGIFLFVIYAEGVRVELPMAHARYRGFRGRYPIKLLYVSNLPVIFASALFGNIFFVAQILWNSYNQGNINPWLNLLGQFKREEAGITPVGGLAYYVIAPRGFADVIENPVKSLIYACFLIAFCVVFSLTWLEVGGLDPKTVAGQLVDAGMQIPGFRRSERPIEIVLKRYIPTVTILGGLLVGALAATADFLGAFGTGTGILLSVGIIYQYYQILMRERITEMYPRLQRLLGG